MAFIFTKAVKACIIKEEPEKIKEKERQDGAMKQEILRFVSAELWNFKNVVHGKLEMPCARRDFSSEKSEILGIYGQNGSGKTTVIDVLYFAKQLFLGHSLPPDAGDFIAKNAEEATCSLSFYIGSPDGERLVSYEFALRRTEHGAYVARETLSCRVVSGEKLSPLKRLIHYDADAAGRFLFPGYRWDSLAASSSEAAVELAVARRLCIKNASSFLFSADAAPIFSECGRKNAHGDDTLESILSLLPAYAAQGLFVIRSDHSGTIALEAALPFALHFDGDDRTPDEMLLSLTEPSVQPMDTYEIVKISVESLNCVLGVLIPNMQLAIREYGGQVTQDGRDGMRFEILSVRGENRIPLKYESEGIKKLISILSILIAMYNHASVCVAVDEFDAGVYEYLLGEILGILEESGKGQLIFTSHNLRPLEMIDPQNIVFTTTNPENRYIRFKGAGGNLRDRYIRSISIGGQKEELYGYTNPLEIARAFRLAGRRGDGNS